MDRQFVKMAAFGPLVFPDSFRIGGDRAYNGPLLAPDDDNTTGNPGAEDQQNDSTPDDANEQDESQDDGKGDGDADGDGDSDKDERKPTKPTFDDEQKRELTRIVRREAKKAADKARADALAEVQREKDAEAADAARKAAEERGEYETVKASLIAEREQAQDVVKERDTEIESLRSEVADLQAVVEQQLASTIATLPKYLLDLAPADDEPLAKRVEWAEKAAKAAKSAEPKRGNGPDGKPTTKTVTVQSPIPASKIF